MIFQNILEMASQNIEMLKFISWARAGTRILKISFEITQFCYMDFL